MNLLWWRQRPMPRWSGASHIGGRSENQDYWGAVDIGKGRKVAVLADGLGGHADGRRAAIVAVKAALASARRTRALPVRDAAEAAVTAAAEAVKKQRIARKSDLASTICVMFAEAGQAGWAHVGDSRIYRCDPGLAPRRLTIDHSVAMATTPPERRLDADLRLLPTRNSLVSVLGQDDPIIDVDGGAVAVGTVFALCSDGFWESASEAEIFAPLPECRDAEVFVNAALERQGEQGDNITLVLFYPGES